MAKNKTHKKPPCLRCSRPVDGDASCETCYEEMRKALLDEITKRDLRIVSLTTQVNLLQEAVKIRAEVLASESGKKRKTA